jgi:hypothetical protein
LPINRYFIFAGVIIFFIVLGCLLNVIPMILLVLPTIFPAITALGFDPIWFGVVTVLTMEMGQITPPIGVNVFAIASVAGDVPMQDIFRGIFPFFPRNQGNWAFKYFGRYSPTMKTEGGHDKASDVKWYPFHIGSVKNVLYRPRTGRP